MTTHDIIVRSGLRTWPRGPSGTETRRHPKGFDLRILDRILAFGSSPEWQIYHGSRFYRRTKISAKHKYLLAWAAAVHIGWFLFPFYKTTLFFLFYSILVKVWIFSDNSRLFVLGVFLYRFDLETVRGYGRKVSAGSPGIPKLSARRIFAGFSTRNVLLP